MNRLNRWFGFVVVLALLTAAACGGGGGSGTLTKAEFIKQADKICAVANDELDALPEPQNLEEAENVLRTGATRTKKLLSDIRALNEPEADRATLEQIYSLVEQGIAKYEGAVAGIRSGNPAALDAIAQQGQALFDQANAASKTYGFKDCSE